MLVHVIKIYSRFCVDEEKGTSPIAKDMLKKTGQARNAALSAKNI
jgi:hypothetical protein